MTGGTDVAVAKQTGRCNAQQKLTSQNRSRVKYLTSGYNSIIVIVWHFSSSSKKSYLIGRF